MLKFFNDDAMHANLRQNLSFPPSRREPCIIALSLSVKIPEFGIFVKQRKQSRTNSIATTSPGPQVVDLSVLPGAAGPEVVF